jgi:hypothetical protein
VQDGGAGAKETMRASFTNKGRPLTLEVTVAADAGLTVAAKYRFQVRVKPLDVQPPL